MIARNRVLGTDILFFWRTGGGGGMRNIEKIVFMA